MSAVRLRAGGPHYYPLRSDSDVGGEIYERELLRRLPEHGIDIVLGLPRDHDAGAPPEGWTVDTLRHARDLHWTRAPLLFTPYALRLLREHRVDLLRGHSVRYVGPSLLAARTLVRARVPVVLHHHHLDPRWRRLEAAVATRADAVITVSEHSRAALVRAGVPDERVHVVYQGIAPPPSTSPNPEAWPTPAGGLRLLVLGRLEPRKRPGLAIDTLAAVRSRGIEASLVIAGEGPLHAELVTHAQRRGVGDRVRLLGRVDDTQKWSLYDAADILLFGSTLEGFGLVVAEAQARGVPVVAAGGTATAEALDPDRSGLLVAPNPEAFARAVAELGDAERRGATGARAREFARRFDWDRCAAGVAEIYRAAVTR